MFMVTGGPRHTPRGWACAGVLITCGEFCGLQVCAGRGPGHIRTTVPWPGCPHCQTGWGGAGFALIFTPREPAPNSPFLLRVQARNHTLSTGSPSDHPIVTNTGMQVASGGDGFSCSFQPGFQVYTRPPTSVEAEDRLCSQSVVQDLTSCWK